MSDTEATTSRTFRLSDATVARMDEIADHLSRRNRTRYTRTDVINYLVDNFRLPPRSVERPTNVETGK